MHLSGLFRTLLLTSAVALSTSALAQQAVVVSSKIDTEGSVLGHLIYQVLDDAGIPVTNRIQLGGTSIVRNALISGEIDIYPEYTGNGAFFFDRADSPVWKDAQAGYDLG